MLLKVICVIFSPIIFWTIKGMLCLTLQILAFLSLLFCGLYKLIVADRLERANSYPNDGEKAQTSVPRNVPIVNHGDAGSSKRVNENLFVGLIPIHGCCKSEAFQLLNDRMSSKIVIFSKSSTYLVMNYVLLTLSFFFTILV